MGTVCDVKNSKGNTVHTIFINNTNIVHHTTKDCEDDDVSDTSNCGSEHTHYTVPPLQTQFNSTFNQQAMFVKNSRKSIPYQDGPLSSSRQYDSIVKKPKQKRTIVSKPMVTGKHLSKHKHIYQVTKASLKKRKKDSDGLIDGGANGGLAGEVMQPMEGTEELRPDSRY